MLILVAFALLVIWALAFIIFQIAGLFIHLLLVAAVVIGAIRLFRGNPQVHDSRS